jgi:DNA repair exonuclease SbcCD nuclease subunit
MNAVPTRLLAIGDIHLGRTPRRLPDGLDPARLGPDAALRTAVGTARMFAVDAVLLAGDVADQDHDFYHALGVLTEALGELGADGIPVLAVAGNHDHEVLPRLERASPSLQLLGRGGVWERQVVEGDGGPVAVLGWSFPGQHHTASPAVGLPRADEDMPTLGLLHADLDVARSRYAPVTTRELLSAGPVRWLLGHVHQPSLEVGSTRPGYLGSLAGLHPNETGPRGPWLIEVTGDQVALRHLPQAPLHWERLELSVDELADPHDDLAVLLAARLRRFVAETLDASPHVEAVGVRVRLVGRAAAFGNLAGAVAELEREGFRMTTGEKTVFVDAIENAARPAYDLAALARADDPPGLLARDLLALRDGQASDLLAAARRAVGRVDLQGAFTALGSEELDADRLTEHLLAVGYRTLDELLDSRDAALASGAGPGPRPDEGSPHGSA